MRKEDKPKKAKAMQQSMKGFCPLTGVLLFVIHREVPEPEPVDVLAYIQEACYAEKEALKKCLRHEVLNPKP